MPMATPTTMQSKKDAEAPEWQLQIQGMIAKQRNDNEVQAVGGNLRPPPARTHISPNVFHFGEKVDFNFL